MLGIFKYEVRNIHMNDFFTYFFNVFIKEGVNGAFPKYINIQDNRLN